MSENTLWFKISVEFFDHPKIFTIPINPRELYQRAICYSKKHLTDGYLTRDTLRNIAKPQAADVCECIRKGRPILEICDEWIDSLRGAKLLDVVDENFFQVHDYLKWNSSKKRIDDIQKKRRLSGSKGGKTKHINKLSSSNLLANCLAKTYPEYRVQSTEIEIEKEEEKEKIRDGSKNHLRNLPDDEWIEELKKNPAYSHIDFSIQFGKMDAWLSLPQNKNRMKTRKFILNWLNKIEKPLITSAASSQTCQEPVKRGNFFKPCGAGSVTVMNRRPLCQEHKEYHERKASSGTA